MIQFQQLEISNFGPIGEMSLSLAQRGLVLIQGDNRDTAAASSNGSGKSHTMKALSWCLFGESVDGAKHDDLVKLGAKLASVRVSWADGDKVWTATRVKPRGESTQLALTSGDDDVGSPTIAATQAEINRLLGMDFQAWRNTVLYGQGDLIRFADPDTTDSERKLILKRILRLDVLDRAMEAARAKLKTLESKIAGLESKHASLEAELRGMGDQSRLIDMVAEIESEAAKLEAEAAKLPRMQKIRQQMSERVGQLATLKVALQESQQKALAMKVEAGKHRYNASAKQASAKSIEAQIKLLKDGNCPTCGAPSDSPHVKRKLGALTESFNAELAAIEAAHTKAQGYDKDAQGQQAIASEIQKQLDDVMKWKEKAATLDRDIAASQRAETEAKRKRESAAKLKHEMEAHQAKVSGMEAQLEQIKAEVGEAMVDSAHAGFWAKGFSNSGLSSHLMDAIIPQMTERANHYLETLADGDISINFDTQSKLKSGEVREKLAINWTIEGMSGTMPSGGQRKKISIAVDLALMDLVASRERAAIDLLLMDEVLDGLDATGKSRVMDLLQELRQKRSTIMVISHDPSLSELFENTITVVKEAGTARLEA